MLLQNSLLLSHSSSFLDSFSSAQFSLLKLKSLSGGRWVLASGTIQSLELVRLVSGSVLTVICQEQSLEQCRGKWRGTVV